jgi:hypothetical protein
MVVVSRVAKKSARFRNGIGFRRGCGANRQRRYALGVLLDYASERLAAIALIPKDLTRFETKDLTKVRKTSPRLTFFS